MRLLLVVYDNDSYIHDFPTGIGYIAAVARKEGIDVEIYNQDVHHYPEQHLTDYLDKNKFDAIGLGVIGGYYQYRKLLKISEAINSSRNRPFYMIAGHGPCPEPEYFLKKTKADAVVMGEGEITTINLLNAVENKQSLKTIKGIAYRDGDQVHINDRQELIADIDTIPMSAYDLFPIEYYRLLRIPHINNNEFALSMITGRGCPFKCNFCYRMDQGFRARSSEGIIEEIKYLKSEYQISAILFVDELLMSSVERTRSLCEDFIKAKVNIKWGCNGRLNYAKKDLLKLMKEAGCVFINYGIEAMDDQILKNMNKALTTRQIISGIENTKSCGISPGFNIIFGNINENLETLQKGVDFLLKYDDGAQFRTIRPVTPYPGSPLYYEAIKNGLIKDCADFYENKHLNSDLMAVNFTQLSDDEFNRGLMEANSQLINNYYNKKRVAVLDEAANLYLNQNNKFRGFRHR